MGLLARLRQQLFGPPNIAALREAADIDGLVAAMAHAEATIRSEAARALAQLGVAALERRGSMSSAQKLAEFVPGRASETAHVGSRALAHLKNAAADADQDVRLAAVAGLRDMARCKALHEIVGSYELHDVFRSAAVEQNRELRLAALLGLGFYLRRTSGYLTWATASTWAAALDSPDEPVREAAACLVLAHCGPAVAAYASGRELRSDDPERREQEIARFEGAIRQARAILAVEDQIADIIGHYWREPDGFLAGIGSEARQIRNVGEDLWRRGEMDAMRRAHGEVVRRCPFPGVGRNLEILWHGIGRWQG